jgi:ribosome-associated toxin RatA of RatAB toxin-antitoxin module
MATVNKSALVPYSAQTMFDLVNDVMAYPDFIPGCVATRINSVDDTHMQASLDISKAGIKHTFTTNNTLVAPSRIDMSLADGPFKSLGGGWIFTELDEHACKIELHLEFEFTSRIIELAFGKIFHSLANSMVDAFIQRAKQVTII